MSTKQWTVWSSVVIAVLLAIWFFWPSKDPHVAKIEALRAELSADPPAEKRRELFGQMREEFEQMTPQARDALFAERRKEWEARDRQQMREFFALPKAKQIAELDKRIDDEKRRAARRAQGGNGGGRPNGQAGPGGGPGGGSGGGGPGGGGPGGGGGGGPGRGGFGRGGGDSVARAKSYLDNSSPETRAQRTEYRQMMQQRRLQRGS